MFRKKSSAMKKNIIELFFIFNKPSYIFHHLLEISEFEFLLKRKLVSAIALFINSQLKYLIKIIYKLFFIPWIYRNHSRISLTK